ncbi:MAG: acyl carrier protein [Candidatus Kaiserbacteria bacterium]|nr:acyl carrier protein [Candidatus Kaiserbacteria bacterium]
MDALKKIFSAVLNLPESAITDVLSPEHTDSWDSLNAIILLTEIEHAFKVKFTFDEAMAIKNFGEVVALIQSKGVQL